MDKGLGLTISHSRLCEEDVYKRQDITIGKELAAVAQKSKALASRDCFGQLEMYLHGRSHDRVCLLFGLLQTGKNTMLRQAIGRMAKEDLSRTAYIKARRTDNMAMMNRDLKKLFTL